MYKQYPWLSIFEASYSMVGKWNPVKFMVFKCLFIEITTDNIFKNFIERDQNVLCKYGEFWKEKKSPWRQRWYILTTSPWDSKLLQSTVVGRIIGL